MLVRKEGDTKVVDLHINYSFLLDTWYSLFSDKFLQGEYMKNLMAFLYLSYEDTNIRPAKKEHVFAPFKSVDMDICRVVFLTEFPPTYYKKSSGLGLGMDTGLSPYSVTKEFTQFRTMIESNLYDGKPQLNFDISLEEAADNGILFLNTALTCTSENNRAHVKHWERFIVEFLTSFDQIMSNTAFVFIGEAAKFADCIDKKFNGVFIEKNSIDFCVQNGEYWNTTVFKEVNDYLIENYGHPYTERYPFI